MCARVCASARGRSTRGMGHAARARKSCQLSIKQTLIGGGPHLPCLSLLAHRHHLRYGRPPAGFGKRKTQHRTLRARNLRVSRCWHPVTVTGVYYKRGRAGSVPPSQSSIVFWGPSHPSFHLSYSYLLGARNQTISAQQFHEDLSLRDDDNDDDVASKAKKRWGSGDGFLGGRQSRRRR